VRTDAVAIVNPLAGGGEVARQRTVIERRLAEALPGLRVRYTRYAGHASILARHEVDSGARVVISVGGDGTHGAVVDGIMAADAEPGAVTLVPLPAGTGSDFCRMTAGGRSLMDSVAAIDLSTARPVDVGRVSYRAHDEREASRHFLNVASAGINGLIDRYANESTKKLGGMLTFMIATARALRDYEPAHVRLRLDGEELGPVDINTLAVCNGKYAGGGMLLAPDAELDDGLFDVLVIEQGPLIRALPVGVKLYRGTHASEERINLYRARRVEIEPVGDDIAWLDVDGEAPGVAPATFEVVAGAIEVEGLV
jgi:YegS/Rv2252/BmrU family lipid kinase